MKQAALLLVRSLLDMGHSNWRSMTSEKPVKSFLRPLNRYPAVRDEGTVRDALRFMGKTTRGSKARCLIVVGGKPSEKEIIKGFVSLKELVFGLTAHFLRGAERSGPIFWEGQFEAECLEGAKKRVGDIMVPIQACVRDTEMLMEAVFLLNKYQVDFLPVVNKDDDVVGMIHLEDILEEISRIVLKQDVKE